MRPSERLYRWRQFEAAQTSERDRLTYLRSAPLPTNSPALMAPTKVRVLRAAFCIKGKRVEADSILTMPYCDAVSLQALGKAEIIG